MKIETILLLRWAKKGSDSFDLGNLRDLIQSVQEKVLTGQLTEFDGETEPVTGGANTNQNESTDSIDLEKCKIEAAPIQVQSYIRKLKLGVKQRSKINGMLDKLFDRMNSEILYQKSQHAQTEQNQNFIAKELQADKTKMKQALEEIDDKNAKINFLEQQLEQERQKLSRQTTEAQKRFAQYEAKLTEQYKVNELSEGKVAQMTARIVGLTQQLHSFETEKKNLEEYNEHLQSLNANIEKNMTAQREVEVQGLSVKITGLLQQVQNLEETRRRERQDFEKRKIELEETVDELTFKVTQYENAAKGKSFDEMIRDSEVNKSLAFLSIAEIDRNSFVPHSPSMLRQKQNRSFVDVKKDELNIDPIHIAEGTFEPSQDLKGLKELERKLAELTALLEAERSEKEGFKVEKDLAKLQIEKLVTENVELKKQLEKMKKLMLERDELTAKLSQFEELKAILEQAKATEAQLRIELKSAREQITLLMTQNQQRTSAEMQTSTIIDQRSPNDVAARVPSLQQHQPQLLQATPVQQQTNSQRALPPQQPIVNSQTKPNPPPKPNVGSDRKFAQNFNIPLKDEIPNLSSAKREIGSQNQVFQNVFNNSNSNFGSNQRQSAVNVDKIREMNSNRHVTPPKQITAFDALAQKTQTPTKTTPTLVNPMAPFIQKKTQQLTFTPEVNNPRLTSNTLEFEFESDGDSDHNHDSEPLIPKPENFNSRRQTNPLPPLTTSNIPTSILSKSVTPPPVKRPSTDNRTITDTSVILMGKMKQMKAEPVQEARQYSYAHYKVSESFDIVTTLLKYVAKTEIQNAFSDYINRINKRTNTKRKIIIITRTFLFIFNLNGKLKDRYPLGIGQITKVQVNRLTNHFNLIEKGGINEVLQSIRKEELLLYLQTRAQEQGRTIKVDYVNSIGFMNSEQKKTILDPLKKKSVNLYLIPTFNYAIKRSAVGYAVIESSNAIEAFFGTKDFVIVLSDMFIVGFTTVEFTLKFVLPLVGSMILEKESTGKTLVLGLADQSRKRINFNNEYDQGVWMVAVRAAIERLTEESKVDTSF